MGFKEDARFARLVSMGAVGTHAVASDLRSRGGHRPIELERYALANKIWQTKVKRLRLPDLVCTACGLRVESRAKSKLGIVLSHSDAAGRTWDAGGMRDDDLFAFLRADLSVFPPRVSAPSYFAAAALRRSYGQAKLSAPKAATEGSEVTLTWPTWVPGRSGTFVGADDKGRLVCEYENGSTYRYTYWEKWGEPKFVYLESGSQVAADETILAGVVELTTGLACQGERWDLEAALASHDSTDRYAAIKVAGATRRGDLAEHLAAILDGSDDWRIRLEATASLALLDPSAWTDAILALAVDADQPEEVRIEATFVLSELRTDEALDSLAIIVAARSSCPTEVRAAAAWGLGQGSDARPADLLPVLDDDDLLVRLHALVAIEDLPPDMVVTLQRWLAEGKTRRAATGAHLLQRHVMIDALLTAYESGGHARLWSVRALGGLPETEVREVAGTRLTDDLETALAPLWLGHHDWIGGEAGAGVDALEIQKVRFDPYGPSDDRARG